MIEVIPLKAFTDNYIWALVSKESVYVVDPGDANPVLEFLDENNFTLEGILITHHHFDHTGGIKTLTNRYDVPVYGPVNNRIEGITHELKENDSISVFNEEFKIFGPLDLIDKILDIGKSGLQINRYKGLGEMNPDQLWETTLDQNERVLIAVKINEVDSANKAFEDLMGGETDARKKFIAENSLKVANLDI